MNRQGKTLGDFLAIAISPVLIMALVGSLVFFLLDILYEGRYQSSLQWILFFFVFGAVLIARISMTADIADRAGLYGLILGLLVWLALLRYVEYPRNHPLAPFAWLVNLGLIGIIWWCAHQLTWDCTLIDDEVDASGSGLLDAAGLAKKATVDSPEPAPEVEPQPEKKKKSREAGGLAGWWQRYACYREERRKQPQAPGVWVVYFSLAALPLFGLGQAQVPIDNLERRRYSFQLLMIYAGSALGLLLATSFLGLRRYLRQRNLRMPAAMTGMWLMVGSLLIALVLYLGFLLPRPEATHPLLDWAGLGSQKRNPSSLGKVGEGERPEKDQRASRTQKGRDKKAGHNSGGNRDGSSQGKNGNKSENQAGGNQKESEGENEKETEQGRSGDNPSASGKKTDEKEKENNNSGQSGDKDSRQNDSGSGNSGGGTPLPGEMGSFLSGLAPLLKWLVTAILVLVIAIFLLRALLKFLANFTGWAQRLLEALRNWWQGWAALWQGRKRSEEGGLLPVPPVPPKPFSAFPDPFLTGREEDMTPAELVRYSFEALEAWAREQGLDRKPQETPLEFSQRLGEEVPSLEKPVRRLAVFYASLAYARGNPAKACRDPLRELWLVLAEAVPFVAG